MKKIALKIIGVVIILGLGLFIYVFYSPFALLPHKHIIVSLPFAASDDDAYLIPMGEMIAHNKANGNPNGHSGIDFGWNRQVTIIASADGFVDEIRKYNDQGYIVSVRSGAYQINYKELGSVASGLHLLSSVKLGQILGYTAPSVQAPKDNPNHQQLHWELTSASMSIDRLCPVNYFDDSSKTRIEKIWNNVSATDQFKSKYPDICNGIFKNKED